MEDDANHWKEGAITVAWLVYILCCGDGTLYTGITVDVEARLAAHRRGKGARYTRGRGPLQLVYLRRARDYSDALGWEADIKRLSRAAKLDLISS